MINNKSMRSKGGRHHRVTNIASRWTLLLRVTGRHVMSCSFLTNLQIALAIFCFCCGWNSRNGTRVERRRCSRSACSTHACYNTLSLFAVCFSDYTVLLFLSLLCLSKRMSFSQSHGRKLSLGDFFFISPLFVLFFYLGAVRLFEKKKTYDERSPRTLNKKSSLQSDTRPSS